MSNLIIDQLNKIKEGEDCGLTYTGNYEDGLPQFIGDNKAWDKFNKGDF